MVLILLVLILLVFQVLQVMPRWGWVSATATIVPIAPFLVFSYVCVCVCVCARVSPVRERDIHIPVSIVDDEVCHVAGTFGVDVLEVSEIPLMFFVYILLDTPFWRKRFELLVSSVP